jgi:hypothetical protein
MYIIIGGEKFLGTAVANGPGKYRLLQMSLDTRYMSGVK